MEMSRQRLRTGVLEASTRQCPHCEGTGLVRTASSAGLSALRLIEDEAARGRGSLLTLRASQEAAIYVLNRKRADIAEIEDRYGVASSSCCPTARRKARGCRSKRSRAAYQPKFEAVVEEEEDDFVEGDDEVEDEDREQDRAPGAAPRGALGTRSAKADAASPPAAVCRRCAPGASSPRRPATVSRRHRRRRQPEHRSAMTLGPPSTRPASRARPGRSERCATTLARGGTTRSWRRDRGADRAAVLALQNTP